MGTDAVAQDLLRQCAGASARARTESVFVGRAATLPALVKGGNEAGAELPENCLFPGLPVPNPGLEKGEVDGEGQRDGADLFVLRPDKAAFWYFQGLLRIPERFMEGGGVFGKLLNYAFRRDGGMSWNALWRGWSKEVEQGLGNGVKVEGWEVSVALGGKGVQGGGYAEPGGSVGEGMAERKLGALWRESGGRRWREGW